MRTHGPALLISALLHLGLLALVLNGATQLPNITEKEARLAVNLQMFQPALPPGPEPVPEVEPEPVSEVEPEPVEIEPPPPESKPKAKPKPKPKPKTKPRPKPEPQPADIFGEAVKPPPRPLVSAPAGPSQPMATVDTGLFRRLEDEYKAALRRAIEANKRYPYRARRLWQEGKVVVGFTIYRDGSIKAIRIVESSGNGLLDNAACTAVEKVSGRFPFPERLERSQWDFTIPLKYSLR
jgi:protein TonB